jgi:hypothetical protein
VVASRLSGFLQQVKCTCWRPSWSARARPLGPDAKSRSITNEGAIMICVSYPSAVCVHGRSEGATFSSSSRRFRSVDQFLSPVYLLALYRLKPCVLALLRMCWLSTPSHRADEFEKGFFPYFLNDVARASCEFLHDQSCCSRFPTRS